MVRGAHLTEDRSREAPGAGVAVATATRHSASGGGRLLDVVGRLSWGVADQAVSSLSNFALGIYVARTFGPIHFGAFSLAFITYTVVLNASRGMATDPMLVRYSGAVRRHWRQATASATGVALLVGTVAGLICLGAGLLLPNPLGPAFVALGFGLPGLMLQDSWRFSFFTAGKGGSALMNDLVWTVLLVGVIAALDLSRTGTVPRCILALGGTAWLAAIFGAVQSGVMPRPGVTLHWFRDHHRLSFRYLLENVAASGSAQIRSTVLGAVAGLASVGYVRGAEILMGPFVVIQNGVAQVAVPEVSKALKRSSGRLARFCFALGSAVAAGALAWGIILMTVLPLGLGDALMKEIWRPAAQLLPAVTLTLVMGSYCNAAMGGLRAMGVSWRSLRAQLTSSTAYVLGGATGAVLGGALGTVWGVAVANTFSALVWWYHLRAALRDYHEQQPSPVIPHPSAAAEPTTIAPPAAVHPTAPTETA